jgi:hypothetical protein
MGAVPAVRADTARIPRHAARTVSDQPDARPGRPLTCGRTERGDAEGQ